MYQRDTLSTNLDSETATDFTLLENLDKIQIKDNEEENNSNGVITNLLSRFWSNNDKKEISNE